MTWNVCPRQSWYSVRDPNYGEYNTFNLENLNLLKGQIFHKEMDRFYSVCEFYKLIACGDDEGKLKEYFMSLFKPTVHKGLLRFFEWYSEVEAKRFLEIKNDGKGEEQKRFYPLAVEEYVSWVDKGIDRNGHIDRLDYLGGNRIRLVEYKTGFSYDVTKSYKLSKLRLELYWYKYILDNMPKYSKYVLDEWMLINPTTETVYLNSFSKLTKMSLDRKYSEMIQDINSTDISKRKLNFYCNSCKYKQKCLIDVKTSIFDIY